MTDEEKIFNHAMREQGGIYIPRGSFELDPILMSMLDVVKQYLEVTINLSPNLPKANIFYANNMSINACAFKVQSQYFIAVNVGTVIRLKEIFDNIVANKKVSNEIFKNENITVNSATFLYFAMVFLVAHEYSHIRFGHCDLITHLAGHDDIAFLNEAMSNDLVQNGLFRQTLEYDADCCAIANSINRLLMAKDYHNKSFDEIIHEISLCNLSCYILFKIFDNGKHQNYNDYDLDNLKNDSHPRPGLRINYIMGNISSLLYKYYNEEKLGLILDNMLKYITLYEKIYDKNINIKNMELGIAYTKKGSQHLRGIHNNWDNVRRLLQPFTKDTLAEFEEDIGWNKIFID